MRKNARALVAAVMTLGAIATAHADSAFQQYGEANYPGDSMQSQPSTLTRTAVIADLMAARANGTLPRYEEWSGMSTPVAATMSTLTRAEVRQQAIDATQAEFHAHVSLPRD